jgi:hypothetical protein
MGRRHRRAREEPRSPGFGEDINIDAGGEGAPRRRRRRAWEEHLQRPVRDGGKKKVGELLGAHRVCRASWGGTGGAAQRRTASREGVGGWTSEGEDPRLQALKAATLALEMVIIAHAAGGFNDGEVMKVFVPSNRQQLRAFEFAKAGICMMIHWWHLRWRKDTERDYQANFGANKV